MPGVGDLPTGVLTHILTTATTHDDLLAHVALCARVHPEWRRAVMGSAAYGRGIVGNSTAQRPQQVEALKTFMAQAQEELLRHDPAVALPAGDREATERQLAQLQALVHKIEQMTETAAEGRFRVLREISTALREAKADGKLMLEATGAFANAWMGRAGARVLEAAVRALPSPLALTEMSLSGRRLASDGPDGVTTFCGLLRDGRLGRQLKKLELWIDEVGDAGVTALAAVLPPTLRTLSVCERVGCGDAGMLALARALPTTRIDRLTIKGNPAVTEVGWAALGAALPVAGTEPHCLSLVASNFGDVGAAALARRLPESRLRGVGLCYCGIGDAGARALAAVIPRCPELLILNVQDNPIGPEGRAALEAAAAAAQRPGFSLELPEEEDDDGGEGDE